MKCRIFKITKIITIDKKLKIQIEIKKIRKIKKLKIRKELVKSNKNLFKNKMIILLTIWSK